MIIEMSLKSNANFDLDINEGVDMKHFTVKRSLKKFTYVQIHSGEEFADRQITCSDISSYLSL